MPNEKKNPKQGSRMLSVEETNAALAKEHAEEELKEQRWLPKSGEPNAPELPAPKVASVEDQVGSSVSTELELGSDGRPLHEPEGNIFPTNSHESNQTAKKLLTGFHREMTSRFQDRPLLLEDLKELGTAGDLSGDCQHLTMPFEDVHRLVTTMRMAEVILNERVQNSRKAKSHVSRLNLMQNIVPTCLHSWSSLREQNKRSRKNTPFDGSELLMHTRRILKGTSFSKP
jgi:hypothetical protein